MDIWPVTGFLLARTEHCTEKPWMGLGGETATQCRVDNFPGTPIASAFACESFEAFVMTNESACTLLHQVNQCSLKHQDSGTLMKVEKLKKTPRHVWNCGK